MLSSRRETSQACFDQFDCLCHEDHPKKLSAPFLLDAKRARSPRRPPHAAWASSELRLECTAQRRGLTFVERLVVIGRRRRTRPRRARPGSHIFASRNLYVHAPTNSLPTWGEQSRPVARDELEHGSRLIKGVVRYADLDGRGEHSHLARSAPRDTDDHGYLASLCQAAASNTMVNLRRAGGVRTIGLPSVSRMK